jgi:hypothetical protein
MSPVYLHLLLSIFSLQILVSPPLARCQPYWYAASMPLIAASFAKVFTKSPDRVLLLPQFNCGPSSFNPDGIHLITGEGERYKIIMLNVVK